MEFSVNRNAFLAKLNDVQRAISTKTAIEILTGLKLDLTDDGLTLTGSNADITIQTQLPVTASPADLTIESTGSIVLPARFFSEIVKKLPEKTMKVTVNDHYQATITSGSASFTINGLDAVNYPHLPEIDTAEQLTIAGDVLKQIISQTVIAVSRQESRPMLTGIHVTIHNGELLAVATDSHRLSQRKITLTDAPEVDYDIIVPGDAFREFSRMIDDNEQLHLRVAENQILFTWGTTAFYSRLLDGMYPETSRLIPQDSSTQVEFNAGVLLQAIERASLLSHAGQNNVVKLELDTDAQRATLSGNSPEVGNVEEELQFSSLSGEGIAISFNPDYMKDALRSFGQATIKLAFTQPLRPFTLVPSDDQGDFIQLITPVRTV
ncbi:DNA polymerase III subunit beta [Ligilactobacillus hohenheimensis]|uniref:DNA polymerase III subunit beta n=1 Tax=Ligilactobacillus hohenheimensis TaxID=2991832 RepID=UPI0024BB5664|nr:DNA polymerase III subunit beta [Ligilactobacillus hohenheimensis]